MTIQIRKSEERGKANHGWLDTKYSFSFSNYHDPRFMGFGPLRVINDDRIAGGGGFPTHGHDNMEIVTYVLEGALEHKDSLGTGSVIAAGDVQRMCAGTGIRHSEFNPSKTETCHLLQIWILPNAQGLTPSYEQKQFSADDKRGKLCLIASIDGQQGSVTINQNVSLFASLFDNEDKLTHQIAKGRGVWLQVAKGNLVLNDIQLSEGDGAAIWEEDAIRLSANGKSEFLLFDMG
jgi:hypothetical protein